MQTHLPALLRLLPAALLSASGLSASAAQALADVVPEVPADTSRMPSLTVGEAVVTGARHATDPRHLPMTVSVVGREQLEERHESSVLPVLNAAVPGFFSTSRGLMGYGVSGGAAGQMSMRGIGGPAQDGLPTTGLLVLIDGHPQYMGLMGHPIADACQSMMAERIEVVRGPASTLYGSGAMGGVVNIVTRRMQQDGVSTDVDLNGGSYGSFQGEATNRARKGRFSSIVTGQYGRTDGHRAGMGFEQYGGYARLTYDISSHWRVWANANVTHFNASNPGATDEPYIDNDQRITRGMASMALENDFGRTSGALSVFYNWGNHRINDGYEPGAAPLDYRFRSKDRMAGVSLWQSASFFKGNRLTLGLDYFRFGGEAWNEFLTDGHHEPSADKTLNELAGYVDFLQDIGQQLTLNAGVRIDHQSQTGTEVIPRAGLALHLPAGADLKASASRGFRNPTIREMYMFPPQNPDLKPESLWSYELSYAQQLLEGRLNYAANLFYINGENLIMRLPNPNGSGMLNQNSGAIENWGAELSLSYRFNNTWSLDGSYSWLHMENPVLAAPEHKLCAGARFAKGRWQASTDLQYIKGLYTDLDTDATEEYLLWNLQGSFRATDWALLYVKGENLLAQRYEVMAGYPMPKATFMGGVRFSF